MAKGYLLQIREHTRLNRGEAYPCRNSLQHTGEDVEDCVARFTERVLNCSLPWKRKNNAASEEEREVCRNASQVFQLQTEIFGMTEQEFAKTLTCSLPCTVDEFRVEPDYDWEMVQPNDCFPGPMSAEGPINTLPSCNDFLYINLFMTDSTLYKFEEVLLYDEDNLIADVGGYLGLLLGANVLMFYDLFIQTANKIKGILKRR